jgi:hypothetical protein
MSHTTKIDSVVISDVGALAQAITELTAEGVRCELLENAMPRAYYNNQKGMETAPYVVKLHDSKYDVGLYDNGQGGYEARADFWAKEVENVLGAKAAGAGDAAQAKMGKLFQRYAVVAAENHAAMNGYSSQRNEQADGTLQLVLNAA